MSSGSIDSDQWRPLEPAPQAVDWNEGGRVHNWRRYVPDDIREAWGDLTPKERDLVMIMAEYAAAQEEWD
jgi:hypothetical protein